jgi:AcrR family transcriptional regulator
MEEIPAVEPARKRALVEAAFEHIATLHHYFPTKEGLSRAVVGHATARFARTFVTRGSPAQRLAAHLVALRDLLKQDTQLCAVLAELGLRAPRDPVLASIMDEIDRRWHHMVREVVAAGVADGSLRADLEPDSVAAALVAACRGVSLPSPLASRAERIDQTFLQLRQWLGLAEI